jgi:hypothetical protein
MPWGSVALHAAGAPSVFACGRGAMLYLKSPPGESELIGPPLYTANSRAVPLVAENAAPSTHPYRSFERSTITRLPPKMTWPIAAR